MFLLTYSVNYVAHLMDHQKAREKHPSQSEAVYINEGKSGKNLKIKNNKKSTYWTDFRAGRSLGSDWIGLLCEIYCWGFFGLKDCFRHVKPFSFQGGHGQAIDVHENPGTVQFIL